MFCKIESIEYVSRLDLVIKSIKSFTLRHLVAVVTTPSKPEVVLHYS